MKPYYEHECCAIYNGCNCAVLCELPPRKVHLIVTSPPYDGLRKYGGHSWDFYGVAWLLNRVLIPGGVLVWIVGDETKDGSESGSSMEQALHFKRLGLRLHDTMIYRKANRMPLNDPRYQQEWEYAFVFAKGKPRAIHLLREPCKCAGKKSSGRVIKTNDEWKPKWGLHNPVKVSKVRGNIWSYGVGNDRENAGVHPAVFPEQLARDHILSWSNKGDTVLDPFNGSGITTKAAVALGRRVIGIEISKRYCNVAIKRLTTLSLATDS